MAPGYRANNPTRRSARLYVDHDVFEGLPVRNWRRDLVTIATPLVHEISSQKDKWSIELPWGMPKDSNLLPQHSQDLLRIARSGRLYAKRSHGEEEEVDVETALGEKPEKKEEDPKEKGMLVRTWRLLPKHQEEPEIELLAKRRKGLTGTAMKNPAPAPTMTKTTMRRTDAAGNIYVEDVVLVEGQALDGEIISQTVIADLNIAKSVIDGVPVQPPRRRPPPPKRKAKGPGRGRKRKLPLAPTSVPPELGDVNVEAQTQQLGTQKESLSPEGKTVGDADLVTNENENEDMEMGDDNLLLSDEECEDGSDDEHSEGGGQGDQDDDDAGVNESTPPKLARTQTKGIILAADDNGPGQNIDRDASSSPDIPLATLIALRHEHGTAGSPLRNVVEFPPTFKDQSPDLNSDGEAEAEGDLDEAVLGNVREILPRQMGDGGIQHEYSIDSGMGVQSPSGVQYGAHFSNRKRGHSTSLGQHKAYMQDNEMLLDGDVSSIDLANFSADSEHFPDDDEIMPIPVQEHTSVHHLQSMDRKSYPSVKGRKVAQEVSVPAKTTGEDDEDTFEDLLGSLEDHLNEQGQGLDDETRGTEKRLGGR